MSRSRLLPEDYKFIELIQQEITEHSAIPLEIKPDRIKSIILDSANWFYEWHPQAVVRQQYLLKREDIEKAKNGNITAIIKIPEAIKFVFRVRKANGGTTLSQAKYLRNPLYGMNRFLGSMTTGGMTLGGSMTGGVDALSHVLNLYEYQTINSISQNNRGVAHDFSELSNQISFPSNVESDLVLEVGVRVPISEMYNDLLFKKHVKGKSLESLAKIIGTYDFKLVGGVAINWDGLKSDGEKMYENVEEEIKGYNSSSFIISR